MAKVAKKKKKTDDDYLSELANDTGGQTLEEAGLVPYFIDSCNLAVNYLMSGKFFGGFPGGRIIESFGAEASGKSLLGYCFLGSVQKMGGIGVHLDCERASSADFAARCGHVDPKRLLTYYPVTLEQVEKKIVIVVKKIRERFSDRPIGIMWDSIGVCPCDRELVQFDLSENPTATQIKDAGGREKPGERAKAANKMLRSLNPFLNNNNATLYVVNQTRQKIGIMMGNPETTSGGGEALKFYASLRIRTGAPKEFVDKKTKMPLGVNMKVKNKKNRHFSPGILIENVPLFFSQGINPLGGLLQALLLAGRVEGGEGKGNYKVNEPWANGEKISFRSTLANPLDPEVLYRCPFLVDADNADQIKEYLSEWNEAIQVVDQAEEIDAGQDVSHLIGSDNA